MGHILITGAGSGFGREIALRLAEQGHPVIAAVEIQPQIFALQQAAKKRGVQLSIEKLDITDEGDRAKAWQWDVDILLNNAGISEGGSVVDIPAENLRKQFEVNVMGTILLTQGFAKKMVKSKKGRIVFMSSVAGLTVDPFTGAYSASKHAIEAFAAALDKELKSFGIQIATVNPGPFLTGFNDRMFETWQSWLDDPSTRVFDYKKLAFPHEQFDPEEVITTSITVLTGKTNRYRNLVPAKMQKDTEKQINDIWGKTQNNPKGGEEDSLVKKAYHIKPGTAA
ncbi:MAG: SDR family oxidoreductase [Zymomonas mobilis]|uniref:Short-subunit dehydrogenase n=1 Tax=Zymomonas mobilis TaxID=542 RepID=A0A542W2A6_ZYMMB|nr:SDR family oxidoreductase [Zymomonas mobilis]TQL17707.1 short-subunit dehydrogenase [Zymomonas mobilis]